MTRATGAPVFGEWFGTAQQGVGQGQAEGDGLARAGLGRNQQIAAAAVLIGTGFQNGGLDRRGLGTPAFGEGAIEGGVAGGEGHTNSVGRRGDRSQPEGGRTGGAGAAVCGTNKAEWW